MELLITDPEKLRNTITKIPPSKQRMRTENLNCFLDFGSHSLKIWIVDLWMSFLQVRI